MTDLSLDELRDFYHRLMLPSFPPPELMTFEELVDALRTTQMNGHVMIDGNIIVAGLMTQEYLEGKVLLLTYLVVAKERRREGLGSHLIKTVVRPQPKLVLAEIEDPRFHGSDENRGDPAARLRFYERMGSKLLPIPYTQPSLRIGSPRVDNLLLITIPSALHPTKEIEGTLITEFLCAYYAASEGPAILIDSDVQFRSLRRSASKTRHLLHPLSDLNSVRIRRGV